MRIIRTGKNRVQGEQCEHIECGGYKIELYLSIVFEKKTKGRTLAIVKITCESTSHEWLNRKRNEDEKKKNSTENIMRFEICVNRSHVSINWTASNQPKSPDQNKIWQNKVEKQQQIKYTFIKFGKIEQTIAKLSAVQRPCSHLIGSKTWRINRSTWKWAASFNEHISFIILFC